MEYEAQTVDGVLKISLSGTLNYKQVANFDGVLRQINDSSLSGCEFNLAGVEFADSTGLSLFVLASDMAKRNGFSVTLANASDEASRGTRCDGIFKDHDD